MSKALLIVGVAVIIIILYLWYSSSGSKQSETFVPNSKCINNKKIDSAYLYPERVPNGYVDNDDNAGYIEDDMTPPDNETIDDVNSVEDQEDNVRQVDDHVVDIINNRMDNAETRRIKRKFITRDTARNGKYKVSNYANGIRGTDRINGELESYLDRSNELIQDDYSVTDNFTGYDDDKAGEKYAKYNPEKRKLNKYKLDEIFNSDNYLPKHVRDDWFEIVPEAISVKNRHLINVSKPIGINTIGTSLRNPSWDIRGTPACPKFVVAPWLQSTIEPDTNLKSLC